MGVLCRLALVFGSALVHAQETDWLQEIWHSIRTSAVRVEFSAATSEARHDASGGSASRSFFSFGESTNHTLGEYESRAWWNLRWILESGVRGVDWCSQLTIQRGWFSDRSPRPPQSRGRLGALKCGHAGRLGLSEIGGPPWAIASRPCSWYSCWPC